MRCQLCGRAAEGGGLCVYHAKAYESLARAYPAWKAALGVSWAEYLLLVKENEHSGAWAREVAEMLVTRGSSGSPSGCPAPP